MFKKLAQHLDAKIDKKAQQMKEQEEHEELKRYLVGYGHDRAHSQVLLGKIYIIAAPGQALISKNKNYFAIVEGNGNFSIYVSSHFCKENKVWSSNTAGKGQLPNQVAVQDDGNLVVYDSKMVPQWASQTNGKGKGPYVLLLDDDGNLILFDSAITPLWESGTARGHAE